MDKGIRSRSFVKTATIAATVSLAAVLLLPVQASSENFEREVRIDVDKTEVAEGGDITLTIGTVDGEPAAKDLYVYLAIDGTATEGSEADYTITGPDGLSLTPIGDQTYDREVVVPQGSKSVTVTIRTRNDSVAEQCEIVRVQGLQRDGARIAFVGIFEYRITASDLGPTPPLTLASVDLAESGDTWTATLNDPGGVFGSLAWFWHRATTASGPWTHLAQFTNQYTLTDEDRGHFLRAEARYNNGDGEPACAHVVWKDQGEIVNPGINTDTSTNIGGGGTGGGGGGGTSFGGNNQGSGSGGGGSGGGTNVGRNDTDDTADAEEGFTDLDTAGEHTKNVRILYGEGVLDGTGCRDTLLCPNGPLLRWEAAVWFVRVLDGKNPENITPVRFTDVDANVWYAPYVERLAELEITVGCSEDPDNYCPHAAVTRAQMATLLARAFNLPEAEPVGFTDTDRTVHAPNIDASHAAGVTDSCSDEPLKFCPSETNSRAEVASYLVRARAVGVVNGES